MNQQVSAPVGEHDPYWDSEEAPAPGIIGTGDSGEVRHYKRQRRTNWTGLVTMFVYLVILGFYVYVSKCCWSCERRGALAGLGLV